MGIGDARYGPLGGSRWFPSGLKLVGLTNAWRGLCKLLAVIVDASRGAR